MRAAVKWQERVQRWVAPVSGIGQRRRETDTPFEMVRCKCGAHVRTWWSVMRGSFVCGCDKDCFLVEVMLGHLVLDDIRMNVGQAPFDDWCDSWGRVEATAEGLERLYIGEGFEYEFFAEVRSDKW